MRKKTTLFLLVSVMLTMFVGRAQAASYTYAYTDENGKSCTVTFTVSLSKATITGFSTTDSSTVVLPCSLVYNSTSYPVYSIGKGVLGGSSNGYNSKLKSIDLSACTSLEIISEQAFYYDSLLTSVSLPISLDSLGPKAFANCTALESIDLSKTRLKKTGSNSFYSCTSLKSVKLPKSIYYITGSSGSSSYTTSCSFGGCTNLKDVNFSDLTELQKIGGNAFYNCTSLDTVDLSNCTKLEIICGYAFCKCSSLKSLNLRGCTSLKTLGKGALSEPTIAYLELPESLDSIGENVFLYGGVDTLKLYCSSVPKLAGSINLANNRAKNIFVPPYMADDYKAATNWASSENIYPFHDRSIGSSLGATTVCLPYAATVPDGCTAYEVTGGAAGDTVTLVSADALAANTPYIVELEGGGNVCFYGTSADAVTDSTTTSDGVAETETYKDYLMKGVYQQYHTVYAPAGSYVLQHQDSYGTAFYYVDNGNKIKVGQFKGYIDLGSNSSEAKALTLVYADGNETTGISSVDASTTERSASQAVYNLQGVRVGESTESLPKGIYIRGGKKFVVK